MSPAVFKVFDEEQRESPQHSAPSCPRTMMRCGARISNDLCQFPKTCAMLGFTSNCRAELPCPVTELYLLENGDHEALRLYELRLQFTNDLRVDDPSFGERIAIASANLRPVPIPPMK